MRPAFGMTEWSTTWLVKRLPHIVYHTVYCKGSMKCVNNCRHTLEGGKSRQRCLAFVCIKVPYLMKKGQTYGDGTPIWILCFVGGSPCNIGIAVSQTSGVWMKPLTGGEGGLLLQIMVCRLTSTVPREKDARRLPYPVTL